MFSQECFFGKTNQCDDFNVMKCAVSEAFSTAKIVEVKENRNFGRDIKCWL